jgi:hypothetical protein
MRLRPCGHGGGDDDVHVREPAWGPAVRPGKNRIDRSCCGCDLAAIQDLMDAYDVIASLPVRTTSVTAL